MDSKSWLILLAYIVGVSMLNTSCSSAEKAPNYSFLKQATMAPPIEYFDYIVVGGGTAGCALAATLSNGATVLLLERGGSPYGNKYVENITNFVANLRNQSQSSASQRFISEDGVVNHRARVLGGGSAINAGFYTRADPEFLAQVGLNHELVNYSYAWVEKKVAFKPAMLQFQTAVKDGLLQAGVLPYNGFTYDHIIGAKFGGTIFDKNGFRHTAADLLEYADPKSITIYLNATVHKILFRNKEMGGANPRANGVKFKDAHAVMHRAFLRPGEKNEVIISAGALGSPQLLMLSGIGPAEELNFHGIEVLLNQPFIGQGMMDNPTNAIILPSLTEMEISLVQAVGITDFGSYIEASSFHSSRTMSSQETKHDDMIKVIETMTAITNKTDYIGLIFEKATGIKSTGFLTLKSLDPNDNPAVKFNYFQDPEDLEKCVKGMKAIIKMIESKALLKFRIPGMSVQDLINIMVDYPLNYRPRHPNTASSWEQFCKDTVLTIWHYHGGCQVNRVVDKDYKVLGIQGLRVIDGSTFYQSPGTNPQATIMMLGRYMGQKIIKERQQGLKGRKEKNI